ncbi:GntR family transcriptional repressor for pyruvate dehydrogenase complex [Croceifilum oryzae]|uniref:GntR family transcriptional repressor for pyruvate dehydrogenase complex n=1 Tax=Croceifilum oryzae TaxID=1553429 RepID=A0AAJ1TPE0_9BACL|nr:FadR/GntR family transcriptional regulator [Croceifilum oryzae]MDQ0418141.1 GntR family transcriptional repressor for pyruvate dehydrogenase complex [Croceifilum oryzae]
MQFDIGTEGGHPFFSEVRPGRGFEDIAMQIKEAILQGHLKDGDRLPNERELGSLFGVSRPTVREAIRSLEAIGVVEVRRGVYGGIFVAEPKPDHVGKALAALLRFRGATISELVEFRQTFEAETAYWAAQRATTQQIEQLVTIANKLMEVAHSSQVPWEKFIELDLAFHEEVAQASHNQIRVAIMLAIHGVLRKTSLMLEKVDDVAWREQQASDLIEIAEAIREKKAELAQERMSNHIERNISKFD